MPVPNAETSEIYILNAVEPLRLPNASRFTVGCGASSLKNPSILHTLLIKDCTMHTQRLFKSAPASRTQLGGAVRPTRVPAVRLIRAEAAASTTYPSFASAQLQPVQEKGEFTTFPASPGVYAVFDNTTTLQYIGLSRRVSVLAQFRFRWLSSPWQTDGVRACLNAGRHKCSESSF